MKRTLMPLAFLVVGCVTTTTGQGTGGVTDRGSGAAGGDTSAVAAATPSLNRLLLTSKDEEVVAIDPTAHTHQTIFAFDHLVNVTSLDVLGNVAYVGAGDNSINAIERASKKLLWELPIPRYENSALSQPLVVVQDGVGYAIGYGGVLTAIGLSTGKGLWAYPLSPSGDTDYYANAQRPTVTKDRVFVGTSISRSPNFLHGIERSTGKRVFVHELDSPLSGSVQLAGDTLLVPAHDLIALDATTGNAKWKLAMNPDSRGVSTPVVSGDAVYVQGNVGIAEGRLFRISLATGNVVWAVKAGNDYAGVYTPTVVGNVVFGVRERGSAEVTTGNGVPMAVSADTGAILWQNERLSAETSPVYANGRLYFFGQDFDAKGGFYQSVGLMSLDAVTGSLEWLDSYFGSGSSVTPTVIADNGVFRQGGSL